MKMNKIFSLCAASLAMFSLVGCSDTINYEVDGGEGRVLLRPVLNCDVDVQSRGAATDDELAANAIIWISNPKGAVRKYTGIQNVPAQGVALVADHYVAEVWAGDSVPASFDSRYYKGRQAFTVSAGSTVQVDVECRIANSAVVVEYAPAVDEVLTSYTMTVGHKAGSLTYNGRDDEGRPGYFMMPSFDKNLTCTLTGTKTDGSSFTFTKVIEGAKPNTKYVLKVKHNEQPAEQFGGALIQIDVDQSAIEVEDVIAITAPPSIEATNFNLAEPVIGEEGNMGEKKLWVKTAAGFRELSFSCPAFGAMLGLSGNDFNIADIAPALKTALAEKGLSFLHFTHADDPAKAGFEEYKVIFDAEFMSRFPLGEHTIEVKAVDNNGKTTLQSIQVIVSDAKVRLLAADPNAVWSNRATLRATVMKEGQSGYGFNYRALGTQQWTPVAVNLAGATKGQVYTAQITGLTPGTTYEYQAVCGDFATDALTLTTETAAQIPNAGFEEWNTSGKATLIANSEAEMFWDSGNHGSATMNKNVTTPDSSVKHSGNYSAKLTSQFVGFGAIGKFAAGNMFVGKFLRTEGTDGVLGWGRSFTSRPSALRGYVKYNPQPVTHSSTDLLEKGEMDRGAIFIAILDSSKDSDEGGAWAFVVKTNSKKFFDKNASNVIAYGEKVFTEATPGSDMVEFNIPLEYRRTDVKAGHIVIVCSSSQYGDYFTGGPSVMNLDDFELVY